MTPASLEAAGKRAHTTTGHGDVAEGDHMLPELDSFDWAEVFGEGGGGNCVPLDPDTCRTDCSNDRFGREDVAVIKGQCEGENDGPSWIVWGQLKDGRWFVARGSCDYTGWDCQASNDGSVAATENDLITFGMDEDERHRFGLCTAKTIDGV